MKFELFFSDLTPDAQKRFLAEMGMDDPYEGNYDVFPIAVIEQCDDEDLDADALRAEWSSLREDNTENDNK